MMRKINLIIALIIFFVSFSSVENGNAFTQSFDNWDKTIFKCTIDKSNNPKYLARWFAKEKEVSHVLFEKSASVVFPITEFVPDEDYSGSIVSSTKNTVVWHYKSYLDYKTPAGRDRTNKKVIIKNKFLHKSNRYSLEVFSEKISTKRLLAAASGKCEILDATEQSVTQTANVDLETASEIEANLNSKEKKKVEVVEEVEEKTTTPIQEMPTLDIKAIKLESDGMLAAIRNYSSNNPNDLDPLELGMMFMNLKKSSANGWTKETVDIYEKLKSYAYSSQQFQSFVAKLKQDEIDKKNAEVKRLTEALDGTLEKLKLFISANLGSENSFEALKFASDIKDVIQSKDLQRLRALNSELKAWVLANLASTGDKPNADRALVIEKDKKAPDISQKLEVVENVTKAPSKSGNLDSETVTTLAQGLLADLTSTLAQSDLNGNGSKPKQQKSDASGPKGTASANIINGLCVVTYIASDSSEHIRQSTAQDCEQDKRYFLLNDAPTIEKNIEFNQQVAKQRADEETEKAEAKRAADIKKAEEKDRLIKEVKAKQSDLAKKYPKLDPGKISPIRKDLMRFAENYPDAQKLFVADYFTYRELLGTYYQSTYDSNVSERQGDKALKLAYDRFLLTFFNDGGTRQEWQFPPTAEHFEFSDDIKREFNDWKCYVMPPNPDTGKQAICEIIWEMPVGDKFFPVSIPIWADTDGYGEFHESVIKGNPKRYVGDQLSISADSFWMFGEQMGARNELGWSSTLTRIVVINPKWTISIEDAVKYDREKETWVFN